jgi:hypothetical protein
LKKEKGLLNERPLIFFYPSFLRGNMFLWEYKDLPRNSGIYLCPELSYIRILSISYFYFLSLLGFLFSFL